MIAKRRLFDTLDSLLNWIFAFTVLMAVACALTFVFETETALFDLLQIIVNALAAIQVAAFLFQFVLSIAVWSTDYNYPWAQMIWSLFRALIPTSFALVINLLNRVLLQGVGFSLLIK